MHKNQKNLRLFGYIFTLALIIFHTPIIKALSTPNFILIFMDDQGYQDVGVFGSKTIKTPNLDNMAKEGMKFTDFYSLAAVCSPSRAGLMTGCYPPRVGITKVLFPRDTIGLNPTETTIAEVLKTKNYSTAAVGKWHLGLEEPNTPNGRGFDYFKGFLCDMIDDYYKHRRHGINYFRENRKEIDPPGHATDLITKWGIDYVNSRKEKNEPFFMFLSYNAPHTPIQPPQDWLEKVKERESDISNKRAKLVALIEHMDHGIGQVINTLKKNGQFKNTLTIFTSDNGGQVNVGGTNGNHRGGKQDMYEGGLKVPTCAVWPDKIKAGTKSKLIGITMDLYPTVCEAAGVKTPKYIEGKSILPTMLSKPQIIERDLVFVRREGGLKYNGQDYHAFRRGNWKLVHNSPFEAYELYNLKDDPLESNNLANTNREKFIELTTALRLHYQRAGKTPWQKPTN